MKTAQTFLALFLAALPCSGCIVAVAGVGAEAGYVAGQENRTSAETIEDQAITASVKTKLLATPGVSALDINVDTEKRVVTLRGVVKTDEEAQKALAAAKSVAKVREVISKLHVD